MARRRSEARRSTVNPEPEAPAAEPEQSPETPDEQPETAVSGVSDEPVEDQPEPAPALAPVAQLVPKKIDRGPRGRFGTIAGTTRCANLLCKLSTLPTGYFVWSFDRPYADEKRAYLAGQSLCIQCGIALHPAVALRWAHWRKELAGSHSGREIDKLSKGEVGSRIYRDRAANG